MEGIGAVTAPAQTPDTMNQTAALQGDALCALIDQAHELLHDHHDDSSTISRQERSDVLGKAFTTEEVAQWVTQEKHPWHCMNWNLPLAGHERKTATPLSS